MLGMERRMTHDEWWAELTAPGRKLTLDEFRALEAGHAHMLLERIAVGLGTVPGATGGYLEQIRNIFDSVLRRVIKNRPSGVDRPAARADTVPSPASTRPPLAVVQPAGPNDHTEGGYDA